MMCGRRGKECKTKKYRKKYNGQPRKMIDKSNNNAEKVTNNLK